MDQLNETKEVENIEQNNEHIEKQKGKCSISNKLEGPSPYEFSYVADFMGYPLDVEVSNIESLKASTIKNFSYYSDSQESNSDILDLEENKINEVENKEQEIEKPNIENIQKENDKPEEKEVPNENQTNNEWIKEMISTSINTSTVKPNEIQRPTEYTAFSEYINNLTIKPPENIEVCAIWEKPGAKIQWVSEWKRYFHFQWLHQMVTKKEVSDRQINCENCLIRQQICAYWGHLCMISPSKFRKWSFDEWQYYFHSNCEERLKESLYYKNVTSKTFIWPSHFCGKCKNAILSEDEKTIEWVRCYNYSYNKKQNIY